MHYMLQARQILDSEGERVYFHRLAALEYECLEWPWLHGVGFDEAPPVPLELQLDSEFEAGAFADYMPGVIPLFSASLRKVLDYVGVANVEYFPVNLRTGDIGGAPTYFGVNVVGKVALANRAKSKSERPFGKLGAERFDRFVYAPTAAGVLDLFRMTEALSTLVVSDRVRQACQSARLDTLEFKTLQSD